MMLNAQPMLKLNSRFWPQFSDRFLDVLDKHGYYIKSMSVQHIYLPDTNWDLAPSSTTYQVLTPDSEEIRNLNREELNTLAKALGYT